MAEGGQLDEFKGKSTTVMNDTEVKVELKKLFQAVYFYVSTEGSEKWLSDVKAKIIDTRKKYNWSLGEPGDRPDFSLTETQWAYVYMYFTRHVYVVYAALCSASQSQEKKRRNIFEQLVKNTEWCLCSIGGGPNTDLAGLCLFLKIHKDVLTLPTKVHVLDRYDEWEGTWNTLKTLLPENYRHTSDTESVTYHKVNFLDDISEHETLSLIGNADLITMVKWLSSVNACKDETKGALENILGKMKRGAVLLFIDTKCDRGGNPLPWEKTFERAGYKKTHDKIMTKDIPQMKLKMEDIHDDHTSVYKKMSNYPLLSCEDVMMLFKKK